MNGIRSSGNATARRLVLCFDGTGNKFTGKIGDTNVVKLYQMMDRECPDQFHYYQPGIGTYVQDQQSNSSSGNIFTRAKTSIETSIDQGFGTSFVQHVVAGYKFLMRYYDQGAHIYIFGFSRGAYTARFLAEMVNSIGLLSMGNEEMVRFAWNTFSDSMINRATDWAKLEEERHFSPDRPHSDAYNAAKARESFTGNFKNTFCRRTVGVHFLGLFDCVNSVASFEIPFAAKSYKYVAKAPATFIRHAVSMHERRCKFKPALFQQDNYVTSEQSRVKEVWFPGNHGDIGGGWDIDKPGQTSLLSDEPLRWMIQEIRELDNNNKLAFKTTEIPTTDEAYKPPKTAWYAWPFEVIVKVLTFWKKSPSPQELRKQAMRPHDMLQLDNGASRFKTFFWWIQEILPFFSRLEYETISKHGVSPAVKGWVPRHWPPNLGQPRDIPDNAVIDASVERLIKEGVLPESDSQRTGGNGDGAWSSGRDSVESTKKLVNGVNGAMS